MNQRRRITFAQVLAVSLAVFWLTAVSPCVVSAQGEPAGMGSTVGKHPAGMGHSFTIEASESSTIKGITDAGKKISEDMDLFGKGMSSLFGDWVGSYAFLTITYAKLFTCAVLLIVVFMLNGVIRYLINKKIRDLLTRSERFAEVRSFWDALSEPVSIFILVYGTFLALAPVLVELKKAEGLSLIYLVAAKAADFAGYIAIFWFIYRLVNVMEAFLKKRVANTESQLDDTLVPLLVRTFRVCIVIIGTAIIVKNLTGLDFGPLLASLGIGGVAVALAAKDSIGNFLGSLTILFDKPFTVGDRIKIEAHEGIVEELGFRSTRIRTLMGSQVSIPNEKIINTTVENIGRRPNIRWITNLFIACNTPPAKVERAVEIVKEILHEHEGMRPDLPPRVYFNGFGDKCLVISVMAWYHPYGPWGYEEWIQKNSLEILKGFEEECIELIGAKPG